MNKFNISRYIWVFIIIGQSVIFHETLANNDRTRRISAWVSTFIWSTSEFKIPHSNPYDLAPFHKEFGRYVLFFEENKLIEDPFSTGTWAYSDFWEWSYWYGVHLLMGTMVITPNGSEVTDYQISVVTGAWMWTESLSWSWTGENLFPWLYSSRFGWIYVISRDEFYSGDKSDWLYLE